MVFELLLALAAADTVPPAITEPVASPNRPTAPAQAVNIIDAIAAKRGDRSPVAVLGSAHLSSLPKGFDTKRFAPLIDRLAAWNPAMIAIEAIPGQQCDMMRRYAEYQDSVKSYCPDMAEVQAALKTDGPAAEAEIQRILATPRKQRPAAERRRLAGLFLAAGDPASASVQWHRLPPAERKADAFLTADVVALLAQRLTRHGEDEIIAVPLAVRLGHERVWPVDDQAAGISGVPDDVWAKAIMTAWDNPYAKARGARLDANQEAFIKGGSALAWYGALNDPEDARLTMAGDMGAAAGEPSLAKVGRRYLAYWETRNLRMAANIRRVLGQQPGGKLLAIVGASHKAHYERYLGMTSDVVIADIGAILNGNSAENKTPGTADRGPGE